MISTRKLKRHLLSHGCRFVRQGGRHEVWCGPAGPSTLPRHRQIPRATARAICKQLGAPRI